MIKATILALLILSVFSFKAHHSKRYDIDINNLSDTERKVDQYFRDNVQWLTNASLGDGLVDGNQYTYQYVGSDVPLTMTQARLDILDDGSYHISQVMKQTEVPTQAGRVAKATNLRRFGNWEDAIDALGWN